MDKGSRNAERMHGGQPSSLGELIHAAVRRAIEVAVDEELTAALEAGPYQRTEGRRGYRNGTKPRTLTGPTGPLELTLPRATLFRPAARETEWSSTLVPRYQRRLREVEVHRVAVVVVPVLLESLPVVALALVDPEALGEHGLALLAGRGDAELQRVPPGLDGRENLHARAFPPASFLQTDGRQGNCPELRGDKGFSEPRPSRPLWKAQRNDNETTTRRLPADPCGPACGLKGERFRQAGRGVPRLSLAPASSVACALLLFPLTRI